MSRLTFITLLSIVIMAVASLAHWQNSQVDNPIAQQQQDSNEPDFYIVNAKTTQFNTNGQTDHYLKATEIKHFPASDFTLANNPNIIMFRKNDTPWHVSANQGRITQNNSIIELWDNVELKRDTPPNVLDLKTSKLTLETVTNLAHTDQDVVITDKTNHVEATGMKAYIDENKIKFLSNVRATHDPSQAN